MLLCNGRSNSMTERNFCTELQYDVKKGMVYVTMCGSYENNLFYTFHTRRIESRSFVYACTKGYVEVLGIA